jgi:nucleotide-binding universal stress UspA family protein
MKKILVPTDFSEEASNATQYACFIAKSLNCQIVLIHIVDIPPAHPGTLMSKYENLVGKAKKDAKAKLVTVKKDLLTAGVASVKCLVEESLLFFELTDIVEREKIDLLIMGTKAYHSLLEVITGSNTYEIIEEKTCPVLVVPPGAGAKPYAAITLATDYKPVKSSHTFKPLIELAGYFDATIELVHVDTKNGTSRQSEKSQLAHLQQQLVPLSKVTASSVQGNDIASTLYAYVQETNTDLLVLISRRRGFFSSLLHHSIVKEMVHSPKAPLLVLPEPKAKANPDLTKERSARAEQSKLARL